jgi:hypothetical protein
MLPIANHFARQVRIDPDEVRNRNAARRRSQRRN